jgi:2,4-dienoyl-CoA reductase-like NADH-dependent reductase (Old Yellow Enzyme family)
MPHLHDPLTFGNVCLSNRLVMPPMATQKAADDGAITDAIIDYYDEKSAGGMGLVIIEHSYVSPEGRLRDAQPSVADDSMLPGLSRLASAIRANGPKCVLQINHSGAACSPKIIGRAPLAPSAIPLGEKGAMPHAMTEDDIARVVEAFSSAAARAQRAGFDGVEIHSAHMYLLNQFYSPLTNRRDDRYGGELENRIRIHLEVIGAVRERVGVDYPIWIRLGACDYTSGGASIEDAVDACGAFEAAGVDGIDISGGARGYMRPDGGPEQGYFADVTSAVKGVVSVPVILTGGVTDAAEADRLLEAGVADLIGVGRSILKDSTWASRALDWSRGQ